jgi:hypothetical protein
MLSLNNLKSGKIIINKNGVFGFPWRVSRIYYSHVSKLKQKLKFSVSIQQDFHKKKICIPNSVSQFFKIPLCIL